MHTTLKQQLTEALLLPHIQLMYIYNASQAIGHTALFNNARLGEMH